MKSRIQRKVNRILAICRIFAQIHVIDKYPPKQNNDCNLESLKISELAVLYQNSSHQPHLAKGVRLCVLSSESLF